VTQPNQSAIELKPVPPPGKIVPADKMALSKWTLRANLADGTLTFSEERLFSRNFTHTVTLALPSTGRPDAVQTVCLADYRWIKNLQTGVSFRLMFLDRDGKALHMSRVRDQPKASQMWPRELFAPLERLGIAVAEEHYATTKAFRSAHPDVKVIA
jgi:hypothetical protein